MRSAQHLASYLRQFFKITRTVQETGWSYVSVMHRLADDAHSMSCKDIRNACAAIASFRKARAAESHAVVPTTTHDDGLSRLWRERDSPLLGVADGEARTQDREGGRDSSPPRELEKAIWKAEEDAVEAMVKQAATQIDTADLRSACRLLALFAFFFRVFHLPFYASFSLKFSQQHLRASSQELADVAHAFGSLCLKDANLFESIAVASSSILSTFSATHLSRLLLSFALVGLSCEALFIDAAPHIVRLSSRFSPDELCHVAFAHARFRIHNPQVLAMLSERLPVAIPALRPRQLAELVISARQLKLLLSPETQASLAERLYLPALDWELLAASLMAVAPLKAVPHSFWQEAAGECLQRLLCLQIANSTETRRVESRDSSEPAVDKDAAMSRQVSSPDICSLDSELSTVVTPENCLMETDNVKDFSADYYFSRLIQPVPPTTGALVDLCACFSRLYATPSSSSNEAPADLQASLALVVSALAGTLCSPLSSLSSPSNFRQGDESYVTTPEILPIAPVKNLQPVEVARLYKALRGIRSALDIEQQSERASDDGRREGPLAVHGDPALLTLSSTEKHADRRDMCASNINRESTGLKADEHNKEVYSSAAYGDAAAVEDTLQGPAGIHSQMNLGGNARDDVSKVDEQGTKEMNIGCQVGRRTSAASRVVGDEIGASTLVQVQQSRSDEKPTGNLVKEKEARMNVTGVKPNPSSPLASHRDIKARNLLDHWVTGVIFRTVLVIQDSLQQLNEGLGDTAARLPSTTQERILEKVSQAAASLTSPEGQRRNLMTLESGLLARFSQLGPDTFTLSQLLAVVYSLVCFHPPLLPVHAARSLSQRGDDGEDDVSMETRVSRMRLQRHRLRASRSWRAPRKSLSLRTSREDDKDGITPLTDRMVSSEDREMHFMKEACQRLAETLCFIQKRDSQREDEPAPALQHLNLVQQYVVRTYIASQYPSMRLWPLRLEHRNGAAGTSTFPLHQSHGGAPSRPGLSFASAAVISEVETHLEAEGIEIHTSFVEGPFTLLAVESDRPIAYVFLCPSFYQRRPSASSDSPQVLKLKQGASSSPGIETSGFSDSSYVVAKPTETGVDTRTMALSKRRLPEAALSSSSFVLCSEVGAALRCLQLREWDLVCLPFFLWRQLPTSEERKKFLLNQRALCLALQNSRPPLSG
ncbi:hypothetical protein CSUI_000833 [Cystoisospora suis]|uniref:RNA-editing substrate-binding complex 6 protein domain-containing protein n=1 Tax=Cystoisospora suis TaxID=483139 RepID=A0A2C6LE18_9APIC|nr:hypothetical protein CSUI_000833 [Cystoisospora suis]